MPNAEKRWAERRELLPRRITTGTALQATRANSRTRSPAHADPSDDSDAIAAHRILFDAWIAQRARSTELGNRVSDWRATRGGGIQAAWHKEGRSRKTNRGRVSGKIARGNSSHRARVIRA